MSNKALEDLQAGRDRWAASPPAAAQNVTASDFCYTAARLSIWLPIGAGILCKSVDYSLTESGAGAALWGGLAVRGVAGLVIVVGLIFGFIALSAVPKYGRQGLLWRPIRGIVLSAGLIAYLGAGFVGAWGDAIQNHKTALAMHEASKEMQADMKKSVEEGQGIKMEDAQPKIEKMKTALDEASKTGSGETAVTARAMSSYLGKLQDLMKDYSTAADALRNPPVLEMDGVRGREQLEAKKEIVQKFLAANEKITAFVMNGEKIFKAELAKAQAPEQVIESAVKGYHRTAAERNDLLIRIRETDQRIGNAMLGMLDVLETNLSGWKFNPEKKKVIFAGNGGEALEKYNRLFKDMQNAAAEQKQLQMQLVGLAAN